MKTSTRILSISAAVLALGAGGFALAHGNQGGQGMGGGMGMHGGMGMGNGGMGGNMHGAGQAADVAASLAATKTELKITAAQEPAWQAFETVVRKQADAHQALRTSMRARMQDPAAAATTDHTAQRESMQKLHAANRAVYDKARQTLYAVLSPEQKQLADLRLGGSHVQGMGGHGMGGHRHAS
ncbi:MAG: Spy/CpxP family protein refolding chaperone [Pseudomonadota bacterium]